MTVCFDEEEIGSIVKDRNTLVWIQKNYGRHDSDESVVRQIRRAFPFIG